MALEKSVIADNEYELFLEYKRTGDKELRKKIIESYTYIAEILSRRFINRGIDYEDIYQVACLGIINAVDRFDPKRGVRFATFATPTVFGEIRKYFRDKGFFIRIPRRLYEIFYRAEQIKRSSAVVDGEGETYEEIARILNLPVKTVYEAARVGDGSFIKSLEQEAYADGSMNLSNVLGVEDKRFLMIEDRDMIDSILKELTDTEREFIKYRYDEELTQAEIAKRLNISQMQVSRMEKKLLKKLRDLYFRD